MDRKQQKHQRGNESLQTGNGGVEEDVCPQEIRNSEDGEESDQ